ncbi:hypothetical protein [Sphingomonas sp. 3-13AW]|uniref:hypothetical protein n=1 Tax=Sphingomonas sp. 3-13AW TaxID=3050450 RepID=UPI003BB5263C
MTSRNENLEIVRSALSRSSEHVTALHVDARHWGAARPVVLAFRNAGIDVQSLNQACEEHGLVKWLARGSDPALVLPRIFADKGVKIIYLTGWGSDPRSADALLAAIYPHVAMRGNLRLVVMNNAAPVPAGFAPAQAIAHADPEQFATHIARLARVDRGLVDVYRLERENPED